MQIPVLSNIRDGNHGVAVRADVHNLPGQVCSKVHPVDSRIAKSQN